MRWTSWVNVVVGGWLLSAPSLLDYSSATASDNDVWVGAMVTLLGITSAAFTRSTGPARGNVVVGIWLLFAPWILAYPPSATTETMNDVAAGAMIVSLASARIWGGRRISAVSE